MFLYTVTVLLIIIYLEIFHEQKKKTSKAGMGVFSSHKKELLITDFRLIMFFNFFLDSHNEVPWYC